MGWAARVCGLGTATLALTACTADAGAGSAAPLGPAVVESADSPTGYEVTFRYANADADQVWLAGDLYFSQPPFLSLEGASESWLGDQWSEGDVSTLPLAADLAPLTRTDDGVWEITTAVPAGTWNYGFVTSACQLILLCTVAEDPANTPTLATDPTATQRWSTLTVAAEPALADDRRGTLTRVDDPDLGVYLPAGFDRTREERYPLLVLSHGAGDDETAWWTQGGAERLLDTAVAEGTIPPVVAVTTDFNHLSSEGMSDPEFFDHYTAYLEDTVIPYAVENLNATTDAADRAFAGLSMGGRLSEHLLLNSPGLFDEYGMWSMPRAVRDVPADSLTATDLAHAATASAVHLGTGNEDSLTPTPAAFAALAATYADAGLTATTYETHGGHTWSVWRQMLADFLETTAFRQ
ncbi:alpha/beta hydrolase-fold protein [Demequina sp. NBRC 110055]|uniref:alpha/beta hydrolase-fold protein n=1 Tax=Demequina sp. NBRC 110055 TaxID=1570344 RepID=UPI0009FCBFF8|nr:alpha/beta hydrolase-fold protein [Demequina sp. NBRC 110055]